MPLQLRRHQRRSSGGEAFGRAQWLDYSSREDDRGSIFGEGDSDPAAKIKAEIEKANPGVNDLGVKFHDGKVELTGSGPVEALQKAILIAGNAMGVAEVKVAGAAASSVDDGTQYYVIMSGDTLSAVAQQFYGDANQYPKIFEPTAK